MSSGKIPRICKRNSLVNGVERRASSPGLPLSLGSLLYRHLKFNAALVVHLARRFQVEISQRDFV